MVNGLRSSSQFGLKLNEKGVEVNFDLFRRTFVLFDLDIDLLFITEVTILADQWLQATPSMYIRVFSSSEDGLISSSGGDNLFETFHQLPYFHHSAMFYGDSRPEYAIDFKDIIKFINIIHIHVIKNHSFLAWFRLTPKMQFIQTMLPFHLCDIVKIKF